MKRYNIIDGAIAYSEDDPEFSMTDYDTVVYIPPFYYAAYKNSFSWQWSISPTEKEGYVLHPGSGRYIGRYHTSGDSTAVFSKSGVQPLVSTTRANFRTYSHAKGENWWMLDIATWSALQLLYLVEFADFNSQAKLGQGYGSSSQALGSTDTAAYHTCYGATSNQYRWIEQPFGRCYDWVDGFGSSGSVGYLGTDNSAFTNTLTGLESSGVNMYDAISYITGFGYSKKFPWAMLPDAASGGSASTYVSDSASVKGGNSMMVGGGPNSSDKDGLFHMTTGSDGASILYGSRLIYIP